MVYYRIKSRVQMFYFLNNISFYIPSNAYISYRSIWFIVQPFSNNVLFLLSLHILYINLLYLDLHLDDVRDKFCILRL